LDLGGRVQNLNLDDLPTLVIGLAALIFGSALNKRVAWLGKVNLPAPVLGGVAVAAVIAATRAWFDVEIHFATTLTDIFLLVFFTTVGLSAKFSALKAGGKPLLILCAMTLLLIIAQNIAGIAVALGFGAHPYYGLLVGSISFVGGPGTAAAWAKEAQAFGLLHAPEVAIAGATLAVVVGAVVAGPITGWLVARHGLKSAGRLDQATWVSHEDGEQPHSTPMETTFRTMLLILIAVLLGQTLNAWGSAAGLVLPGFLTAMIAGVLITNGADLVGKRLDYTPIERDGEFALQTFLVMYLMSLKFWTLGSAVVPLLVNVAVQVVLATAIAYFLLFRLLGRDYDAALTVGGFLGFGLSSMTVGMASMDKVASRYGPSPKAFLLVTLAGSFFVDLANAVLVKGFLLLPMFKAP
jgi:ESS family glutamate:Na+ symporter